MGRPAAFVDRDGTLIVEREYLADPAGVEFVPGAIDALRGLRDLGYRLVVVTNQSGIGRGIYSEADYQAVRQRIDDVLAEQGIRLDGVYHCPHHPEITGPCECRKPGLGLYRQAERELGVDLAESVYIGDRSRDVLPALQLGGLGLLVLTGYGAAEAAQVPAGIEVVSDLMGALLFIRERRR